MSEAGLVGVDCQEMVSGHGYTFNRSAENSRKGTSCFEGRNLGPVDMNANFQLLRHAGYVVRGFLSFLRRRLYGEQERCRELLASAKCSHGMLWKIGKN